MLKTIPISKLVVDMYVAELIGKEGSPMPKKKRGMVRDVRIINKFVEIGIVEVVIDTDKGLDTLDSFLNPEPVQQESISEVDSAIREGLASIMLETSVKYRDLKLEWGTAKEVFDTSVSIVTTSIDAVKNGQAINPQYFRQASAAISRSVLRNKDALTWLGRFRDVNSYLYEHSVNSSVLMGIFAHAYGLDTDQVEQCITGALLHDLGEALVDEALFEKNGPLTDEEYEEIKQHVQFGLDLLDKDGIDSTVTRAIVHEHHERCDGSGYPKGLPKDEISVFGRMFAIVDTYDAVTNNRTYKEAAPSSVGMRTLLELSGQHFDEALVHQFIKCMGVYPTGSLVKLSTGYLAVVIGQNPGAPLSPLVRVIFNPINMSYVDPKMLNLALPESGAKITSYEDPREFKINTNNFMPEDMDF